MQICTNFTDSKMTAVDLFVGHHNKQLSDVIFMSFCWSKEVITYLLQQVNFSMLQPVQHEQ